MTSTHSGSDPASMPIEKIKVETRTVACDGGKGALGHPINYLNMGSKSQVTCPYCGRVFILSEYARHSGIAGH